MNGERRAADRQFRFRILLGCCVALLSACSMRPAVVERDGVPAGTHDPASIPDAVPRLEIPGTAGNRSPYTVNGRSYHVLPTSRGYVERGIASWYGSKFHGRRTSNGEVFDAWGMTAAHRSLPIPVYARVTNLENGRSTVVRVNDRGPFHDNRIIDLSYAAALKLGFARKGTARVEVRVIDPVLPRTATAGDVTEEAVATDPASAGPASLPGTAPAGPAEQARLASEALRIATAPSFFLQVGAFRNYQAAMRLVAQLETLTGSRVIVDTHGDPDTGLHRVRVGPLPGVEEANRLRQLIADARFGEPLLVRVP